MPYAPKLSTCSKPINRLVVSTAENPNLAKDLVLRAILLSQIEPKGAV
jgi:hypothetical protein